MTLEEFRRLDAGVRFGGRFKDERVPTLEEVFALTRGRCGLNIEIKAANGKRKDAGGEAVVCDLVSKQIVAHEALETAMVSSFDWPALAIVRHLEPRIRIGLLASRWPARLVGGGFRAARRHDQPAVGYGDGGFVHRGASAKSRGLCVDGR